MLNLTKYFSTFPSEAFIGPDIEYIIFLFRVLGLYPI